MLNLEPITLIAYAATLSLLLWLTGNALASLAKPLRATAGYPLIMSMARGMLVAPPFIILIIASLLITVLTTETRLRFIHAIFTLGLWMSANLMILVLMSSVFTRSLSATAAIGVAIALPLAIVITPISGYTRVLTPESILLSGLAGVVLILFSYWGLLRFVQIKEVTYAIQADS